MAEDRRIVEAILGALRFRNASPERLLALPDSAWEELLLYADLSHLTLALSSRCSNFLPPWVRVGAEQNLSDNRMRVDLIRSVYLEVESAFAAAGVEYIVIKGFAQCPEYSPRLETRFQSDIDLYCPAASQSGATDALTRLGYDALPTPSPADHQSVMTRGNGWKWRGNMYDPEMPPAIEVHHRLWNSQQMRFGPKTLDSFWFRRTTQHVEGLSFPTLHPVDNLGFSALQVLRDLLGFVLLAHKVYELAYFLHRNAGNKAFWSEWANAHDQSLRTCQAVSFCLAEACFGCEVAPEVVREIETLPRSVVNWISIYGSTSLKTYRTLDKKALWVHFALVRSLRDKLAIILRMIPKPPETRKALHSPEHSSSTVLSWKQKVRYLLYCCYRAPLHAFLIPKTVYNGLCMVTKTAPFVRTKNRANKPTNGVVGADDRNGKADTLLSH